METTPNDLRQQQFEIKFRGYNPDDVEVFRDLAAAALEEARAEILQLNEENKHLKERLEHLVALEETLKAAVLETQKNAETTIGNAKSEAEAIINAAQREADLLVKEASLKRDEIVSDMHQRMGKLVGDINKIRFIRSSYLTKLKSLVESQLEIVEQAINEDDEKPPAVKAPEAQPEALTSEAMHQESGEIQTDQAQEPVSDPEEHSSDEKSDDDWQQLKEHLNEE